MSMYRAVLRSYCKKCWKTKSARWIKIAQNCPQLEAIYFSIITVVVLGKHFNLSIAAFLNHKIFLTVTWLFPSMLGIPQTQSRTASEAGKAVGLGTALWASSAMDRKLCILFPHTLYGFLAFTTNPAAGYVFVWVCIAPTCSHWH